jgi:RimJ/RimL family protein N-acetyltransferase
MAIESIFCFPVRELENERLKLVPFNVSLTCRNMISCLKLKVSTHLTAFFEAQINFPEIWAHIPRGPYGSESLPLLRELMEHVIKDPTWQVFATIDKTHPPSSVDQEGALAGVIAYLNSSTTNMATEIGLVVVLPPFQRPHVTSNAVGLLQQYALNPAPEGLGLRRVVWMANALNVASIRAAERMSFRKEGVLRWERVFHDGVANGKQGNGRPVPKGQEKDLGRDSIILALCWDDWEEGAREKVQAIMDRR